MSGAGQDSAGSDPAGMAPQVPARSHWLGRRVLDTLYLVRAHRPIGIWLLLWPTLWAVWVASNGHPSPGLLLIFIAGTVLMRSAGCVVNDLSDIDIDPHVRRTRDRPLAARRLSPQEAVGIFLVLVAAALALVLQLNALTVKYSFVGAGLTITYPLLKRFFPIPQLYLGLAFGWAIPMAFAAQLGEVPRVGWVMMLAAVVWAGVYDSFYAIADRADDLRIGVKSSAITFGDMDLVMIGAMQVMVLAALAFTGRLLMLGTPYYFCLGIGAAMFALQQWMARRRDPEGCLWAFNNNNFFGLVVLAGFVVDYTALR
jgi:4-hydroxybenzoate polyprenyltransferase